MKRQNKSRWTVIVTGLSLIICHLSFNGCARMGSPDGGWYDDTPPKVIGATPNERGTDVKSKRVTISFNEFIKLEDAQNKVIVSPPQMEMPDIKAQGKRIVVNLVDSLKPNTTYTIDFSDAITDFTENNPMGNYTFSFSTGQQIDTMQVSGYALDASNLEPIKGILVGLYPDSLFADSIFQKEPMIRIARTNGSGFFAIRGVAPGRYRIRALKDNDGDFVYGQKSETIGFSDEIIVPDVTRATRQDTIWKDSLRINNIIRTEYDRFLPDDVVLPCFQAQLTDRYLIKTERNEPEKLGFFFSYGSDSLPRLRGLNFDADDAFIIEPSAKLDTIYYWLRDTMLVNQDTLAIEATYMMTDSTGVLIQKTDTIEAVPKIPYAKRMKAKQKEFEKWKKEQEKLKKRGEPYDSVMSPDFMKIRISARGGMAPNENLYLEMPTPLDTLFADSIHLYSKIDTLWYRSPHMLEQLSPRVYVLRAEWRPDVEYSLEIDSAALYNIYGQTIRPIKQGLRVKNLDEFSSVFVNLTHLPDSGDVVVQLLDNGDKAKYQAIAKDGTAEFYYVNPGKYYLRAYIDFNRNGHWDTGDYDAHRQPEPVFYHHEGLECKAKWDLTRDWDLTARPLFQQKPGEITKQKPDQQKQLRNRNAQRAAEKGIEYVPKQ